MALRLGFRNTLFDDTVPLYLTVDTGWVFNRIRRQLVEQAGLTAAMTREGYTPVAGEIGAAPATWTANHWGFWNHLVPPGGPPAPAATAITAAVAGTGTASATITFGGGPAPAVGTVTLTATAGTAAITGLTPVAIAKNDTAVAVAGKVATALNGKQDTAKGVTLAAAAAGAVVTVTEAGGANIVTLTAVVA